MTKLTSQTTLAQFVQEARNKQYKTLEEIAVESHLPVALIQDIEAGIETFLAPTARQKLARALKVLPFQIKQLEKEIVSPEAEAAWARSINLRSKLLNQPEATHDCPECKASLIIRSYQREDLNGQIEKTLKVQCSQCLFSLQC